MRQRQRKERKCTRTSTKIADMRAPQAESGREARVWAAWASGVVSRMGQEEKNSAHAALFGVLFYFLLLVFYLVSNFKYSVQIQILIFGFQICECQNNIIPVVYCFFISFCYSFMGEIGFHEHFLPHFCFIFSFIIEVKLSLDSFIQTKCITTKSSAWDAYF